MSNSTALKRINRIASHILPDTLIEPMATAAEKGFSLSTHVLDTTRGLPAPQLEVTLEREASPNQWTQIFEGKTNADGRIAGAEFPALGSTEGNYRITFNTAKYFKEVVKTNDFFYPYVSIVFTLSNPNERSHYHVPLLISPYGYSTYRGS